MGVPLKHHAKELLFHALVVKLDVQPDGGPGWQAAADELYVGPSS